LDGSGRRARVEALITVLRARLVCCALSAALLQCEAIYAAPVPPDAGQTLRELRPPPAPEAPREIPPLTIEGGGESNPASDIRFMIKSVQITGNTKFSTPVLHALVADVVGGEHSLTELRAAVARISDYYRKHGYPVARAYLPAQEIRDGAVTIGIIEGRLGKLVIENHSRLSDGRVGSYLAHVKEGAVIRSPEIDRSLLLLNDTPGVGGSRATLQPGADVGTSDLVIAVNPAGTVSGDIETDNYGNRYTGQYRLGGTLNINSPLRIGDQVTLNALSSGRDLLYGRIGYQLPIAGDGLRAGAAYFDTRYRLGKDFSALQAHGTGTGGSAFVVYPFVITQKSNLSGTVSFEERHLTDYADATATVTEKHVYVATLGLSGAHRDTLGGSGLSSVNLSLAMGDLDINTPIARLIDELTVHTEGRYVRLSYGASRVQQLTSSTFISVALSGQRANKNLDTSEKFSLGGAEGVRAYPQGEDIGDEGYMVNLELRQRFTPALQGLLLYDTGSVTTNRKPFDPSLRNSRKLAGPGVGLEARLFGFQAKAALAWRTVGGEPNSIPASAVHTPTAWVQIRRPF
jgi:hemolysin activation/secretion protein